MVKVISKTAYSAAAQRNSLRQLYDFYRTSLLNVKYYGFRLARTHRLSLWSEILVIVGSAASGASGWAIWSWGYGKDIWLAIAAAATAVAAIKPVLQINKRIELYSRLYGGHTANYLAAKDLVERVQVTRMFTPAMLAEYRSLYARHTELAREDEPLPSKHLLRRFQSEVQTQIPAADLWWPD